MSFDLRPIRQIADDPLTAFVNLLSKKISRNLTKDQIDSIEDNEDLIANGQDIDVALKWHDELSSAHDCDLITPFYVPFEPDGSQVKLYLRGTGLGNTTEDRSGFGHHATIAGEPILVDGTLDLGIIDVGAKSVARRMNRLNTANENLEYMQVTDHADLQITSVTPGSSFFVRFRMKSLALQDSLTETIFHKVDDSTPSNAYMLQVSETGKLIMIVKKAGTTTSKETATGTIAIDTVYDVFITFTTTGNVIHIYVNGVDKTLSNFAGAVNWQATLTNHDLSIFRRGVGSTGGYCYADFYDLIYYKNRVITQTEVSQHFTNKWTIANIAFRQVAITDYWCVPLVRTSRTITEAAKTISDSLVAVKITTTPSYTSTSYTTTSFRI